MQYFLNRGQVQGPYTREQIIQYVQQNQLTTQDLIANQAEGPYFGLGTVWQLILNGTPLNAVSPTIPASASVPVDTLASNASPQEPQMPSQGMACVACGNVLPINASTCPACAYQNPAQSNPQLMQPGLSATPGQLHSTQTNSPPSSGKQTKTSSSPKRARTILIASAIGVAAIGLITLICMAFFGGVRGPRSGATALEGRWQYEFVSGGMRDPIGEIYFQLNENNTVRLIEITGKDKLGRPIVLSSDYDISQNVDYIDIHEARGLFPEGTLAELGNQVSYAKLTSESEFGYDQTVHLVFNGMGNEARARIDVKFGKSGNTSTIYAKFKYLDNKTYDEEMQRDFPEYQEVTGQVTVNGKPLGGNYQINFVPKIRNRSPIASGMLKEDGSYQLFSGPLGLRGIQPGKYRVSFAMLETDEQSFRITDKNSKDESSDGGSVEIPGPKLPFPSQYGDAQKSPLEVEIVAGKADYDFELESP